MSEVNMLLVVDNDHDTLEAIEFGFELSGIAPEQYMSADSVAAAIQRLNELKQTHPGEQITVGLLSDTIETLPSDPNISGALKILQAIGACGLTLAKHNFIMSAHFGSPAQLGLTDEVAKRYGIAFARKPFEDPSVLISMARSALGQD